MTLSDSTDIIQAVSGANRLNAQEGQRGVAQLLYFVDEQFGPDFCLLVTICILRLGHLTSAKKRCGRLTVSSTAAFGEKFGCAFRVKLGTEETKWLFDYFDTPDDWLRLKTLTK